jgi:tetratricopeptide (TPR) repeat protein
VLGGGGGAIYVFALGDPAGIFSGSGGDDGEGGHSSGGKGKKGKDGKGKDADDAKVAADEARKKEIASKIGEAKAFMKAEKWAQAERVLGEVLAMGGDTADAAELKVKASTEKATAEKYEEFVTSIDAEDWLGAYELAGEFPKDSYYFEKTASDRVKVARHVVLLDIDTCIRHIEAEEFGKATAECQAAADIDPASPTIAELKKIIAAKSTTVPDELRTKPKVTIGDEGASAAPPETAEPAPDTAAPVPDKGDKGDKGKPKVASGDKPASDGGGSAAARTLLLSASKNLSKGKYDAALKDADGAVKAAPKYAAAHMARARALEKLERKDEAIEAAKKAAELDPFSGSYMSELARFYYDANRLDDALSAAEMATDLKAGYEGYRVLGRVYKKKGMNAEAVDSFKKWLSLSPTKDKSSTRDMVEVIIKKSPPPKKTSGAKCLEVEDCPGMELCDAGVCG